MGAAVNEILPREEIRVLPFGTQNKENREVVLLCPDVEAYISQLEQQGCVKGTIAYDRRALNKFAGDLSEGNTIEWDINLQPELSRAEYLHLLSVAKVMEDERGYLLIKLFATTGILLQELPKVTVETVESGKMDISSRKDKRIANVPEVLRAELLSYATSNMITTGPIFVTHSNTPLSRSNVTVIIQKVSADANVPTEKVSPRSLKKLYQTTIAGIEANISVLVKQAYDRLLNEELLE